MENSHPQTKNVDWGVSGGKKWRNESLHPKPIPPSCTIEAGSTSGTPHLAGLLGTGENFFIPKKNLSVGHVGGLRKSWVFAQPEVALKDCDDTESSPFEKKRPNNKKTAFLEICQRPLWVFSSHSLVEKKLRPLRGLTIVPVWAATHGSVLLEILNEGSTPQKGRKMPWKNSMEAFTIGGYISLLLPALHSWSDSMHPVGHVVGGKETCHFLQWLCFCFAYFLQMWTHQSFTASIYISLKTCCASFSTLENQCLEDETSFWGSLPMFRGWYV